MNRNHGRRDPNERNAARGVPYASRDDAMQWADEAAARLHIDAAWMRRAVGRAEFLPAISRAVEPAANVSQKNWRVYRSRFIDATRIGAGVAFWQEHERTLAHAERDFGVPPEVVCGILGVETIYGQQRGNYRVIDSLATLSFDFPQVHPRAGERATYFRFELEQFLSRQHKLHADPLAPLGSYAGAVGMPQFMPSSVAHWAVDYSGDGRIDLTNSPADAIGSVANYFKRYGWQPGLATHFPVAFNDARLDLQVLLEPDILPTFTVPAFLERGVVLQGDALQHKGLLALVELRNGDNTPQYVAGTENFFVITRYNWSAYYAMAVIELGQEVKRAVAGAKAS